MSVFKPKRLKGDKCGRDLIFAFALHYLRAWNEILLTKLCDVILWLSTQTLPVWAQSFQLRKYSITAFITVVGLHVFSCLAHHVVSCL